MKLVSMAAQLDPIRLSTIAKEKWTLRQWLLDWLLALCFTIGGRHE
jgi:hypothetical protein